MNIPTEPIGSIPRPLPLDRGDRDPGRRGPVPRSALRRGDPRHHRAVRGDGLARDHRRRAAEVPQFLDVLRARAPQHGPGRLQDPVRGRPRPPDAPADRRALPLQEARGQLPGRGPALRARAGEAGGHLAVGLEPDVPHRSDPRLLARGVPRRSAARARDRDPQLPAQGRAQGPDRFHGRAAGGQDRSVREPAPQLHRPEQPRPVAVLGRGPPAHRRAHLPRRRPRLDPQRGRRLRRPAAQPVRAEGGELLHRPGRRARSRPGPEDHPGLHEAGPAGLRRRGRAHRPAGRDAGGDPGPGARSGGVHSDRPAGHDRRLRVLARSATTPRPPATPRSRRYARACSAPRWPRTSSEAGDGPARGGGRGEAPPLRRPAERAEHPPRPPARRGRAGPGQGSAGAEDARSSRTRSR